MLRNIWVAVGLVLSAGSGWANDADFGGGVKVGAFDVALMEQAARQNVGDYIVLPVRCTSGNDVECYYSILGDIQLVALGDSQRSRTRFVRVACAGSAVDAFCLQTIRILMRVLDPDASDAKHDLIYKQLHESFMDGPGAASRSGVTARYTLRLDAGGKVLFDAAPEP